MNQSKSLSQKELSILFIFEFSVLCILNFNLKNTHPSLDFCQLPLHHSQFQSSLSRGLIGYWRPHFWSCNPSKRPWLHPRLTLKNLNEWLIFFVKTHGDWKMKDLLEQWSLTGGRHNSLAISLFLILPASSSWKR